MRMAGARTLLFCGLVFGVSPGCQLFQRHRPVAVLVQDAETKQPISGAEVRVVYPFSHDTDAPAESAGTSGADGVAHIEAVAYGSTGVLLNAGANGYLNEQTGMSLDALRAIQPAGWFENVEQRPAVVVIELYPDPRPSVELVVPTGFRGVVRATLSPRDNLSCPPGQRQFCVEVPASGVVEVQGPALLRRVTALDITARYEHGAAINREPESDSEIGLRWLQGRGAEQIFVVGTRRDFEEARKDLKAEAPAPTRPAAGDGNGRGQGKRRGRGFQTG